MQRSKPKFILSSYRDSDLKYMIKLQEKGVMDPQPARNEKWVKDRVKELLHAAKCYYTMPMTGGYGKSGVPDFLASLGGIFVGIECKSGDHQPTTLQMTNLLQIHLTGGFSIIVNDQNVRFLPLKLLFIKLNYTITKRNI